MLNTILAPIDNAVAWIITQLFNLFGPVFGDSSGVTWLLTIVVLVMLMRLILVPLFIKQMHTQRAMTALTPKLQELRKKHKGDRETLNAETMKVYQEAGVNPLMGCLPVVLQMPIFFGLFNVLRYIAEWKPGETLQFHLSQHLIESAKAAKIFGATIADKVLFTHGMYVPLHAKVVIFIAVVVSMTTTFLTVRQSQKRGMMPTGGSNPMGQSQKLMAYFMPLFALTGLYWQFGLVLYWVTTNVWTLAQQFVLLRRYPVGAAAMGPEGNVPTGGAKPATASGLLGRAAKPRPGSSAAGPTSAKGGQASAKGGAASANGTGKATPPGKPSSGAKPGSTRKPSTSKPSGQGGKAGSGSGRGQQQAGRGGADGSSNGAKAGAGDGGMLRRFGRKAEAEPVAEPEPQTRIVRQQRTRQSRSKRSGKR